MELFTFEDLVSRFVSWAQEQEEIEAAIIIGSRARSELPADEWSDLDIIVLTGQPEKYIYSEEWLEEIHPYSITFLEKTTIGDGIERRVMFDPYLDVDFALLSPDDFSHQIKDEEVQQLFKKGYRILFDKTGVTDLIKLQSVLPSTRPLPSQDEYTNAVNDFWYHIVWQAKKMLRGEDWVARACLDGNLKGLLTTMAEWHAIAVLNHAPWHNGRFIEDWADPRLIESFSKIFTNYERTNTLKAMKETMEIFRLLAIETGIALECHYPAHADRAAVGFVYLYEDLISQDNGMKTNLH
ncbi:aminoglycoside 6-adenylyltransferase [Bacillus sp. REN3]|uniref:aminoglycoside 6-adenylyltransferase n=1 Tax=Bacillus sp. REN3 TaxID=2802440 RepID=UPI001AEE1361|nr:aminoglycoside 6-adenylyltransferase [Bacillus sp. REN3]